MDGILVVCMRRLSPLSEGANKLTLRSGHVSRSNDALHPPTRVLRKRFIVLHHQLILYKCTEAYS